NGVRPGCGLPARASPPLARYARTHLLTVTGWTPRKSATSFWDHPSLTFCTASRRRASLPVAVRASSMMRMAYHAGTGARNPDYLRISKQEPRSQLVDG